MKSNYTLLSRRRMRALRAVGICFLVFLSHANSSGASASSSVFYNKLYISGVSINVVTVDLNDSSVRITLRSPGEESARASHSDP